MNANELANKLEQGHWEGGTREQASTMLRQQDYEIQDLAEWKRSLMEINNQQQTKIIYLETALALEGIVPNYEFFGLLEKAQKK